MFISSLHKIDAASFLKVVSDPNLQFGYSQFGEDRLLSNWLIENDVIPRSNFYVDVGAYHAHRFSNTKLLSMLGWRGLNIEPDPRAAEMFKEDRPNDIYVQAAVGSKMDRMFFHRFTEGAVNTFDVERAEILQSSGFKMISKEEIEVCPLSVLLDRHLPNEIKASGIGLLDIDCEGMDSEILLSLDLEQYRPSILLIENDQWEWPSSKPDELSRKLLDAGYQLKAFVRPTMIWVETK